MGYDITADFTLTTTDTIEAAIALAGEPVFGVTPSGSGRHPYIVDILHHAGLETEETHTTSPDGEHEYRGWYSGRLTDLFEETLRTLVAHGAGIHMTVRGEEDSRWQWTAALNATRMTEETLVTVPVGELDALRANSAAYVALVALLADPHATLDTLRERISNTA